jgi:hypothetical protein
MHAIENNIVCSCVCFAHPPHVFASPNPFMCRWQWLRKSRQVRAGEEPTKRVKTVGLSSRRDREENCMCVAKSIPMPYMHTACTLPKTHICYLFVDEYFSSMICVI